LSLKKKTALHPWSSSVILVDNKSFRNVFIMVLLQNLM
jgi:hypothetical protein